LNTTFSIEFTSTIAVFDPLDHDWSGKDGRCEVVQPILIEFQTDCKILHRRLWGVINNVI